VPQLEITRAALAPEHAHATQEYLMAIRAWPAADRTDRRATFLESCAAARLIDEAKALPGTLRVEMLDKPSGQSRRRTSSPNSRCAFGKDFLSALSTPRRSCGTWRVSGST
jgi:hypothetical protein